MPATNTRTLERALGSWQQAMIAIGGTIGVGLFLGSGATIGLAGPAVVVTYLVAAIVAVTMGLVLAEMTSVHPITATFGEYADRFLGPWFGFATRLSYLFAEVFAIGAQITAVGVYMTFWFPDTPGYVFMIAAGVAALALNALHVGRFGTLDAAFSMIKVVAIVGFILVGTALILGDGRSLENLTSDGGFFPNGVSGIWLSLTLVVTSFFGIEAVAITAGEAERPETTVPRAFMGMVGTLIGLYVLAMLVILIVSPWRTISETSGTLTGSPFVEVFATAGIPYAAGLMSFVVVSAALTAAISHLYLTSRMLRSLAEAGYAPAALGRVDARGVPMRALAGSAIGMVIAVVLAANGRQVFLPMYGTAVIALLSTWIVLLLCHFQFRLNLSEEDVRALRFRAPWHPLPSLVTVFLILAAMTATPWVAGLRWTVPLFALWLAVTTLLYRVRPTLERDHVTTE